MLQHLYLDWETTRATFRPHKGLLVKGLVFLRVLVHMFMAMICLQFAWTRFPFCALTATSVSLDNIISERLFLTKPVWGCFIGLLQPLPCYNGAEQLIPSGECLSFLLLPLLSSSLLLSFCICLVEEVWMHKYHINFRANSVWYDGAEKDKTFSLLWTKKYMCLYRLFSEMCISVSQGSPKLPCFICIVTYQSH